MLYPNFKLISFELSKDLGLHFYFEAALLLEAYQLLLEYRVPFARLNEFWDENSQKLLRFSERLTRFLELEQLTLPKANLQVQGQALKKTPQGLFLLNLLQLKQVSQLEAISSVFTSPFIADDLITRHSADAYLRRNVHAYVDLKTYASRLHDFRHWQDFAEFNLPLLASLCEWLKIIKGFFVQLQIKISATILSALDAYFLPVDRYLAPLPYQEFLAHFNLFLEDTFIEPTDAEFYLAEEQVVPVNPFINARLIQEFNITFPNWVAPMPAILTLDPVQETGQAYRRDHQQQDVLQNQAQLKLHEQVGGAAILNQQAACPFKAFAHFQLKLQPLVVKEAWLSAKFKGIAIHRILEKIWDQLKTQRNLLNLSEDELKQLVYNTSSNVIFGLGHQSQFFLPESLAQLEIRRLTQIILAWLEVEKQRPEFKVKALETESLAYLGNLVIKLRLDRIDELADGRFLVLDYKTGSVDLKEWLAEPMGDVQLPLYVLTTTAAGALLAEVNSHLHFSGIVDAGVECFSEVKSAEQVAYRSWEDLKQVWQKNIRELADEISQGIAQVRPAPGACDYCDLHKVCRVKEHKFNFHEHSFQAKEGVAAV